MTERQTASAFPTSTKVLLQQSSTGRSTGRQGRSFQTLFLLSRGEGERGLGGPPKNLLHFFCTHLATGTTIPTSLLISLLAEPCGSATISRSNFPCPSRTPSLSGTAVKGRKAAWLSLGSSLSTAWLWGLGITGSTNPPDHEGFRAQILIFPS